MFTSIDMIGRNLQLAGIPKRIISVVPSQTELLFDLGLRDEVIGITKFCVHPEEWFRNKTRIGGTKKLNIEKIRELQPDLIIANKEENEKSQIDELAKEFPVWISDIQTMADALRMIEEVGRIVGKGLEAGSIIDKIKSSFATLQRATSPKRTAYFIWYDPWMSVGSDTFISHMIDAIGWENVFAERSRYPEISMEVLAAASPELVLLSSEPFPFKEKHIAEIKSILPDADVLLVDGEMFSWYGSRLLQAPAYFSSLLQGVDHR